MSLFCAAMPLKANIYATNIRLNDHGHPAVILPGVSVEIDYLLNEAATGGASVQIFSDTNLVRTLVLTNGAPGTFRGTNAVIWDGNDDGAIPVTNGFYTVAVTAAAIGYTNWTQITDDSNPGNSTLEPRGIAVNQNTNSPYYGRVFIGNSPLFDGATPDTQAGILKLNADGSPARDGIFSTGGHVWGSSFLTSPWKIEVSADDKVYVNDWSDNGLVLAFDQKITTNNFLQVLREDNWSKDGNANLSGPFVTGSGTNTQIWMADISTNNGGSAGIIRWQVTADGTLASNDVGTVIIPITDSNLTIAPYDVAVDGSGNIYTIQRRDASGDPANRVFRFPAYDESGNPETNMDWAVGAGDDTLANAYGISVDPSGTFVAVAARGYGPDSSHLQNGGVSIFLAANGTLVTNIVAEQDGQHTDTAWDKVGNLYETDPSAHVWRAYSPPGTNQATTAGVSLIQVVNAYTPPALVDMRLGTNNFHVTLLGQSNVTYVIESSTNLIDWIPLTTNYSADVSRNIRLAPTEDFEFYRARVHP